MLVFGQELQLWLKGNSMHYMDNIHLLNFFQFFFFFFFYLTFRLWSDPSDSNDLDLVPKETFSRLSIFRNRLVEYGLKAEPLFPKYCAQNQDECL